MAWPGFVGGGAVFKAEMPSLGLLSRARSTSAPLSPAAAHYVTSSPSFPHRNPRAAEAAADRDLRTENKSLGPGFGPTPDKR